MKIKMLIPMSGPEGACNAGDVVERDSDEAQRLIKAGYAEAVRKAAKTETATKKNEGEKAVG